MIEFDAIYYDGRTSARKAVRVQAYTHSLYVAGEGFKLEILLADVQVEPPLAGTRRILHLPGGAQLQTDADAALRALFPRSNRLETWVHALESRWSLALAGVVAVAAFSWWCVVYGLPLAARLVAAHVPVQVEAKLGEQTLASIDQAVCGKSDIGPARQDKVRQDLAALTAGLDDGYDYRLEFRACKGLGANAFALPGGTIVITDALVRLAANDAEISAVLAHEIGHVRHRHGLRLAIQAAGLAALIAALAGDAVSITGLAVTLPTALLQSGYTRELETEADDYAFQRLREIGLSPKAFAEIMLLLEKDHRSGEESRDYFSTHPATAKRIERALAVR